MDSITGLIIQFSGIFLITILLTFLTGSLSSDALKYWKYGWFSLSAALLSLYVAFTFDYVAKPFYVLYYLGEYAFVFLLIAGCRNYALGKNLGARGWLFLVPAVCAALLLAFPADNFNTVFNLHSSIMAAAFLTAFITLRQSGGQAPRVNFGWRVMRMALLLLALDFFHYTLIFSLRHTSYPALLGQYLAFNPIIDLVLEILLGFGMVIVLLESVRRDVEETNHRLKEAHDKLERLAHVDPLTAAFTRHAFYGFLQKHNREDAAISGCVGVFDIDNLKPINDTYGHAAGDVAISSTAHAIRSLVRADDLIFRWGGDEFFVVMLGFDTEQAVERMCGLEALLTDIKLFGLPEKTTIGVSFGFADFADIADLEKAIAQADAEMYRAKQQGKCSKNKEHSPISQPMRGENPAMLQ